MKPCAICMDRATIDCPECCRTGPRSAYCEQHAHEHKHKTGHYATTDLQKAFLNDGDLDSNGNFISII